MKKLKITYFTIYLVCLLAVCLLYYVYGYQPINTKTNSLQTQHQENIAQIAQNDAYVKNLSSIKADTEKLAAELKEKQQVSSVSGSSIADDINAGLNHASITKLGRIEQGAETAADSKVTAADGKKLCSVPITMNFQCTSLQLTTLLNYFESSTTGAYYVNKVSCTEDQKANLLSVNLTMSVYYFGTPDTASKSGGK